MRKLPKLYTIVTRRRSVGGSKKKQYRFKSLYNSCKGGWSWSKEKAVEQGEKHEKIILALEGQS